MKIEKGKYYRNNTTGYEVKALSSTTNGLFEMECTNAGPTGAATLGKIYKNISAYGDFFTEIPAPKATPKIIKGQEYRFKTIQGDSNNSADYDVIALENSDCHTFKGKITKVRSKGTSSWVNTGYQTGFITDCFYPVPLKTLDKSPKISKITTMLPLNAQGKIELKLELTPEALAMLKAMTGAIRGSHDTARKYTDEVYYALPGRANSDVMNDDARKACSLSFADIPAYKASKLAIKYGYKDKPAPVAPKKRRMPDGKYAKANYREVKYPEHGTGDLVTRHILFGEIVGDNVHVSEWNTQDKVWSPKTYKLSKIRG